MKSIPRLIAGTAVVLAAVLTAAPVTAGIADLVLNPGQQPAKRAAPSALPGASTAPTVLSRHRDDDADEDTEGGSGTFTIVSDRDSSAEPTAATEHTAATGATDDSAASGAPLAPVASSAHAAGLVALTAADADSRVSELAGDLQAGVAAGEFSQADADRVLGDLSSYIRGERTWPERTVA
ncbi:hypothetical protein ACH82I_16595 [Brevibacterium sp. GP-SGM9]|uniref:hypothetical protein n=1 Tax=Brevibacterium sp. GP-SGM9 TaxID=3376990 RepID=UPI0039A58B52